MQAEEPLTEEELIAHVRSLCYVVDIKKKETAIIDPKRFDKEGRILVVSKGPTPQSAIIAGYPVIGAKWDQSVVPRAKVRDFGTKLRGLFPGIMILGVTFVSYHYAMFKPKWIVTYRAIAGGGERLVKGTDEVRLLDALHDTVSKDLNDGILKAQQTLDALVLQKKLIHENFVINLD